MTKSYPRGILLALMLVAFSFATPAYSQPVFSIDETIKACDDFATIELDNPWDMSDSADVNNFTANDVVGLGSTGFSSGLFAFNNAQAGAGHFYLLSPQIDSLQPVGGRWGQNSPLQSSKYRYLTIRMNLNVLDPAGFGIRALWHRGRTGAAGAERTVTNLGTLPTNKGWNSYSIDLSSLTSFDGISANPSRWNAADIHGFGLYPLVSPGAGQIDYIRLEDPASCGTTSFSFTSTVSGNRDLVSFFLDYDGDLNNFLAIGTPIVGGITQAAALTPQEAWQIDKKLDDGAPALGRIMARKPAALPNCATSAVDATATYNLTNTSITCNLNISVTFK